MPGSKQAWPNRAACWSPAMALTGTPASGESGAERVRRHHAEATARGSHLGERRRRDVEQVAQLLRPSAVHDVEEQGAARRWWRRWRTRRRPTPPVRFHSTHESTVASPRSGRGDPALVGAATASWWPRSTGRGPARCVPGRRGGDRPPPGPAHRPRCGGPARRWPGAARPRSRRSQATTVSRWLVIPMARASRPASASRPATSSRVARTVAQISPASCSTQPGRG